MRDDPRFTIYTGDSHYQLQYGRQYRLSHLHERFNTELPSLQARFFTGLVLADSEGKLWVPKLTVQLVPAQREDADVPKT